jgi:hypothetical protein
MWRDKCIENSGRETKKRLSLERLRRQWEDNKINLTEIGCDDVGWIHLVLHKDY